MTQRLLLFVGSACWLVCSTQVSFAQGNTHASSDGASDTEYVAPRCELIPLPDHQVSFRLDGHEKIRWHFGDQYPRPFLFPFNGPSGQTLTRMGHPGAQNHDHHRSIWFAHHRVDGMDFWSDENSDAGQNPNRIRQTHWYRYRDGDHESIMACALSWQDGQGVERMRQDVVIALLPVETAPPKASDRDFSGQEYLVEFQLTFRPGKDREVVTLGTTNFGFLAVRVAASISGYFGGGILTNDQGIQTERHLHERKSRWMDYSGPIAIPARASASPDNASDPIRKRRVVTEGITYFDHPSNPTFPTHWHVRQDGWMGASPGMKRDYEIRASQPLVLRYLLHSHGGPVDLKNAEKHLQAFAARPGFLIRKPRPEERHRQYEVERKTSE